MSQTPYRWTTYAPYPLSRGLFQGWVLDVVLRRVLVGELVHDVDPLPVGVVDLHERLPLIRERVLGEDRLDRALRFAGTAVQGVDPTGKRELVFPGDDSTERLCLGFLGFNAH